MKKLYYLSRSKHGGYDTYDSAVVCAENKEQARGIHPSGRGKWDGKTEMYGSWCAIEEVLVEEIGNANKEQEIGVIVASFNAG